MNRFPAENGFQAFGAMWAVAAKPWLADDYRGLYYPNLPNILGIIMMHSEIPFLPAGMADDSDDGECQE